MSEKIEWEYRIEVLGSAFRGVKPEKLVIFLNDVGMDGWEVVSVHQPHSSNQIWVTMKRIVTKDARRRRSQPGDPWQIR